MAVSARPGPRLKDCLTEDSSIDFVLYNVGGGGGGGGGVRDMTFYNFFMSKTRKCWSVKN